MSTDRSALSTVSTGMTAFIEQDCVLRFVEDKEQSQCRALFSSGLISQLMSEGLIPATQLLGSSSTSSESFAVRQDKVSPVIYPFEWSPEMLRAVALCVLRVNEVCNLYGYELIDAHPYNVVFHNATPLYVDIGSFKPIDVPGVWKAEKEFMDCYLNVLKIAERGLHKVFSHAFVFDGNSFGGEQLVFDSAVLPYTGMKWRTSLRKLKYAYKNTRDLGARIGKYRYMPSTVMSGLSMLFRSDLLPFRRTKIGALRKRIRSFRFERKSRWGDYHASAGFYADKKELVLSERMQFVVDVVKELGAQSVLELAGNQGVLSRSLARLPGMQRVVCSDYDYNAVDQLFLKTSSEDEGVYAACFDFMRDTRELLTNERASRLRSDLVVAMAVVHHLTLTQGFALEAIVERLSQHTNQFLIVEFMPLGLWDGVTAPPLPDWYSEEWFERGLKRRFSILQKQLVEENRVVYVAQLSNLTGEG